MPTKYSPNTDGNQLMDGFDVHPRRKKPIGNSMPPRHMGYSRSSGWTSLPASKRFVYTLLEYYIAKD